MNELALLAASGGAAQKTYVDDVFSAWTRTGTGADVTVTTGIDMTKGYLLWSKGRSGATDHALYDSDRGLTLDLASNTTAAQTAQATGLKAVSATGHTIGSLGKMNTSGATYVDWVFRKQAKFFDSVTYTGDGTSPRTISHSLGSVPGCIVIKRADSTGDWWVYHNGLTVNQYLKLNTTDAAATAAGIWGAGPTTTGFTVNAGALNAAGATYVAYLYAHDTSTDGIIQCGSFTTDGSGGNATVNLGWEPQFLMVKSTAANSQGWDLIDASRGMPNLGGFGTAAGLEANNANAEGSRNPNAFPTATGFFYARSGSVTYIYMAIRRSNKPPTLGTQVYNAIARTGTGATTAVTGAGFAPDFLIHANRSGSLTRMHDRLRGAPAYVVPTDASSEVASTQLTTFNMDGFNLAAGASSYDGSSQPYLELFFKRAPGVFDQVCYTGTGVSKTEAHNLGAVPELMIVKRCSATSGWPVRYSSAALSGYGMYLNDTGVEQNTTAVWTTTAPTSSVFSVGTSPDSNANASTYVVYLFATKAGISKVGSYTGNGSSQTINCGFTTGARFVRVKRTDSTGDWYVWDSARGIVAANDPHLSLNSTVAEVTTDDSVDPDTSGFIVNQVAATNINVNLATYIFLAIA